MPTVIEDIPSTLQPAADAALKWLNDKHEASYKLTGLVDPDPNWQADLGLPTTLALVLCENDVCAREQVHIQKQGDGFVVSAAEAEDALIPPHLDPPIGVRMDWFEERRAKHKFIVLLFYRGFW
ncbi:MAG: hypothetical protein AAF512_24470 [Pseudomonadota bacterium]